MGTITGSDWAGIRSERLSRRGEMTNRGAIVAAFVAGAMLVAVAVVAYGAAPTAEMSLAEKKAALAALSHQKMQELKVVKFGADRFGDTGKESGNLGKEWNVGAAGFKHHGAKAGSFGKFAIDSTDFSCQDHIKNAGTRGCGDNQIPSCNSGRCMPLSWINDGVNDCDPSWSGSLHCYCEEQAHDCPSVYNPFSSHGQLY